MDVVVVLLDFFDRHCDDWASGLSVLRQ